MIDRRSFLRHAAIVASAPAFLAGTAPAFAKQKPIWFRSGKVAANGYDPVAYFTMSKPVRGSKSHTTNWNGAEWRFSSADHKARFEANPAKYAPAYGGHCAFAMSKGYIASTVPDAWTIVNGKLYLNYSKKVRGIWEQDKAGHIKRGNANWPKQ